MRKWLHIWTAWGLTRSSLSYESTGPERTPYGLRVHAQVCRLKPGTPQTSAAFSWVIRVPERGAQLAPNGDTSPHLLQEAGYCLQRQSCYLNNWSVSAQVEEEKLPEQAYPQPRRTVPLSESPVSPVIKGTFVKCCYGVVDCWFLL